MDNLSTTNKERVVTAIERAVKLANEGSTPDAALLKVAQEEKLKPEMVKRVVEAFNTSKTLAHLKHAADDSRADSFDIASAENILGKLYPAEIETQEKAAMAALHPAYRTHDLPDFTKAAEAALPPLTDKKAELTMSPQAAWTKAAKERGRFTLLLKEAEDTFREIFMKLLGTTKAASNYWRQVAKTEDFALVEKRAYATYGPPVRHVMDMIFKLGDLGSTRSQIKRAAKEELGLQQMHFDAEAQPYSYVADAMLLAKASTHCRVAVHVIKRAMADHAVANVNALPQPVVEDAIDWAIKNATTASGLKVKSVYKSLKSAHAAPSEGAALDDLFDKRGAGLAGITGGMMTSPTMPPAPQPGTPVPVPQASPVKNPAAPVNPAPAGSSGAGGTGGIAPAATPANQKITPTV